MTSARLAEELEVAPRTILRDVDAMTEAGLPIIVHQGNRGGIELGFNYRSRLTGLARDEAEALGIILSAHSPVLAPLGLTQSADHARVKLLESLPDGVRSDAMRAARRFRLAPETSAPPDPRITALAEAVRAGRIVVIRSRDASPQRIHPSALILGKDGWAVEDALGGAAIPLAECGDINISALRFSGLTPPGPPPKKARIQRRSNSRAR